MFPRELNPFLFSDSPQIWAGPLHLKWTLEFLLKHNYALEVKRSSVSAHLRTREEYRAWEWSRHEQKMKQELEIKIKEKGRNFFISLLESWIQLVLHTAFVFSKLTNSLFWVYLNQTSFVYWRKESNKTTLLLSSHTEFPFLSTATIRSKDLSLVQGDT